MVLPGIVMVNNLQLMVNSMRSIAAANSGKVTDVSMTMPPEIPWSNASSSVTGSKHDTAVASESEKDDLGKEVKRRRIALILISSSSGGSGDSKA